LHFYFLIFWFLRIFLFAVLLVAIQWASSLSGNLKTNMMMVMMMMMMT